jgi:hypothetical protein
MNREFARWCEESPLIQAFDVGGNKTSAFRTLHDAEAQP